MIAIKKIKEIVEDYLCNIQISKVQLREHKNDYYLLGKWDLAQEINDILIEERNELSSSKKI